MVSLLKIFHILPPQEYKSCVFLFILMFISVALETIGVGLILPFIAAMGNEEAFYKYPQLAFFTEQIKAIGYNNFIIMCAIGLICFYFLKNLFLGFTNWMQIRFVVRNQNYYSKQLFAEYLFKPYLFHLNSNMGEMMRNVNNGGVVVFGAIVLPVLNLIVECATAGSIWLLLMFVDPLIATLVSIFFGGLVATVIKSFRGRIDKQGDLQKECQAKFLSWASQGLGSIKITKVMHTEDYFLDNFDASYRRFGEAMGNFQLLQQLPRLVIEGVVVCGLLLLVILKIFMGSNPNDIVPLMGLLGLVAFRLMPSANRIVAYYNAAKFQMPFFHEIYPEFMAIKERNSASDVKLLDRTEKRFSFAHEICMDHVAFSYDGVHAVLQDVSFKVKHGDYVGIIGVSGVGKTTFVDILLGLFEPTRGRITVDGVDILTDIRGWQENLAYVPQGVFLIDGSIKENIAFGQDADSIDDVYLEEVIRMAELYDFVQELPDGVETSVGEQGSRLSGGQRQRIGIARALYQKPEVLVLDEATSALDTATEKSVVDTILKLKGKMTIISIAHRISTLDACDYKIRFYHGGCEVVK